MNARTLFVLPLAFCSGMVMATFAGCSGTNDSHCANKGGDAYCQEKLGLGAGEVFCTNNCGGDYDFDGCLVASEPPADGCWLCDGEGSENCDGMAEGSGTETATETATDTTASETASETTAESSTTEGPECMDSSMCGGEMPLCEDGACVACGAGVMTNCASEYPETPACDATGACVECTSEDAAACSGMTPVCEGNVCVACDEHEQCPDSACNMSTGACMDPSRVWWVDQSVAGPGTGTMADPYKEFAGALGQIANGQEGVIMFATPGAHLGDLVIPGGRTVALIGASPNGRIQSDGVPAISVNSGAVAFLGKIEVSGGNDIGLSCTSCDVWINASSIVKNSGAIRVLNGGAVKIWNSFIGVSLTDIAVMDIQSGNVDVLYTTVVGNTGASPSIQCAVGTEVVIRNSVVASRDAGPEICASAMVSNSAIEMDIPGNTVVGPMNDGSWFMNFNEGDYHLTANAPAEIATAATWQTGDPATDIDGDARLTVDDTPDYAGADIPN